jgi:transposase
MSLVPRQSFTRQRLFAWLQNFRRVLVRHKYHAENYLGFVHVACIVILLRWYL